MLNLVLLLLAINPILDAKALGAKGDNSADDSAALQGALDAISRGEATTLYIPPGNYRVTAPLKVRPPVTVGVTIRGESGAAGGNGTALIYDGPLGGRCVLEVAGGFGVRLEKFKADARGKAQFGIYLHDDMPRAGMSDVVLRDVSVGSPLPGDSPALAKGAKSAAISIGLRPNGQADGDQCDSITLSGVTITSSGDEHAAHCGVVTGIGNVKNVFLEHPWISGFQYGVWIPTGTGTCTVTGGAGLSNTVSDFGLGSGVLAVTGWQSEGSARLLSTSGWNSGYASASFDRCAWYGQPADDIVVFFGGALALRGNDIWNNRTATSVPKIALISPQDGSATSLVSEQNFYRNIPADATPFMNWNATASLASANGKGGSYPPWVRSFGDLGGSAGKLVPLGSLPATAPATLVTPVDPDTLRAKDLVLTGSIDFGDGRRWGPDGLFMDASRYWTPDGLYPGMIKFKGSGTLTDGPDESLRFIGWTEYPKTGRRQGFVVPPLRGNK